MTVHNFKKSLAQSHAHEGAPWWREVYSQAFTGLAAMVSTRGDGWAQRAGIDRVITLKTGRTFWIDEKVREKDWPDVLLERWSDTKRKTPGWIQKRLAIDYLAYAYIPSQTCLFFPFPLLQRAWRLNGHEWIDLAEQESSGYRVVIAENEGWVTQSIAVPRKDLFTAISGAMVLSWKAAP